MLLGGESQFWAFDVAFIGELGKVEGEHHS